MTYKSKYNLTFWFPVLLAITHTYGQSISYVKIIKEKNDSIRCELLLSASEYYKYQNVDTLLLLSDEMYKVAEKIKSHRFLESACNLKGLALKFKGDFSAATTYTQKALEINDKRKDKPGRAKILLNYADLMRQQKQFDASEQYHREGIGISRMVKDSTLLARYYINTGLMFADIGKLDSASNYYIAGIAITDKVAGMENVGITARLNLSHLASKQGKYHEMIKLSTEVYEYGLKNNDADHISLGANNVSVAYLNLDNYDKAMLYIALAEDAAKRYNSPQNLLYAIGTASDIFAKKGDFRNAYLKALAYVGLKDSLRTALYDKNLLEITTKFELKQKESLLRENHLTIQQQTTRQRLIIWLSLFLLLTATLMFFYLKSRQDLRRKTAEMNAQKAQLQAEIEHAEVERLKELEDMKNNFFTNISHEFRTPLTLILNPTEILIKDNLKTEQKKYLHIIKRNAGRLLELVNQLLEIAKIESGTTTLKLTQYDFKQFCITICGLFESLAAQKEIDFRIEIPEGDFKGYFDKDIMEKIIVNLISNAFKFTPTGGVILFVLNKHNKGEVEFYVKDTGIGISKENIENLFNKFMSFSKSDLQNSSGIGMSLVRELVHIHKGKIEVTSEPGAGSVFSVSISLNKDSYADAEIINLDSIKDTSETVLHITPKTETDSVSTKVLPDQYIDQKPVLLVAEDNPDVRFLISDICIPHYRVFTTENGKQAYQTAIEKIPDIILTDIMMPEMDGTELCNQLRTNELTSHIPIVMLTARGDQKDKLIGFKTGADDYLIKPFDADELLVRLENLLDQRKKLREYYKKTFHTLSPAEELTSSMDAAFMNNIKQAIEKNISKEHYGVSELSADMAISRSQLHRKVTGLLGYSPNEVIRNMRLEKARMMILKKTGTIAEIAYKCGFSSPAYFSKCYKDYFGHTAGEEV